MKCILCRGRKGKRWCPARRAEICAQCCGEKRVVEIDCPSDCVYLCSCQSYQQQKTMEAQFRGLDELERKMRIAETHLVFDDLLVDLEAEIVYLSCRSRLLADRQILTALQILFEGYRHEQAGIVYRQTSPNPGVEALVKGLYDFLEEERVEGDLLRSAEILQLLDCLIFDLEYHMRSGSGSKGYLNYISKNHPEAVVVKAPSHIELAFR